MTLGNFLVEIVALTRPKADISEKAVIAFVGFSCKILFLRYMERLLNITPEKHSDLSDARVLGAPSMSV